MWSSYRDDAEQKCFATFNRALWARRKKHLIDLVSDGLDSRRILTTRAKPLLMHSRNFPRFAKLSAYASLESL